MSLNNSSTDFLGSLRLLMIAHGVNIQTTEPVLNDAMLDAWQQFTFRVHISLRDFPTPNLFALNPQLSDEIGQIYVANFSDSLEKDRRALDLDNKNVQRSNAYLEQVKQFERTKLAIAQQAIANFYASVPVPSPATIPFTAQTAGLNPPMPVPALSNDKVHPPVSPADVTFKAR